MGIAVIPAPSAGGGKTRKIETLTSGTSWTVPANVTYVNATLVGAGAQGQSGSNYAKGDKGVGGQVMMTTVATTPGASIGYAIGAANGGSTTFTGATTAVGGNSGSVSGLNAGNGGAGGGVNSGGSNGGDGYIILEYWV